MIYLRENVLLREPLRAEHLKPTPGAAVYVARPREDIQLERETLATTG